MNKSITTHSVARGFVTAEDIVLDTTPRTRLVLRANIHTGGVRGHMIRQKIGKDGSWKATNEVNFTMMPADCGVSIELNTKATALLYAKLSQLYQLQEHGVEAGDQKYVVAKEDEVLIIDDRNKGVAIQALLDQGHSEEFWEALNQSNPDAMKKRASASGGCWKLQAPVSTSQGGPYERRLRRAAGRRNGSAPAPQRAGPDERGRQEAGHCPDH
jgi:hypothetical protein